jgi:hypothetical protein
MIILEVTTPVRLFVSWGDSATLTGHVIKAIIMPDDVAYEKVKALEALGAGVERVRPASIVDKKQASLVFQFLDFSCLQVFLCL